MDYRLIKGASLLEIMITLLISSILLTEIFRYSSYLENVLKLSGSQVESIEKNNVLFASMVRDIEMAGYVGCVKANARENIMDDNHYLSPTWLIANGNILQSQYMSPEKFAIMDQTNEAEVVISGDNHFAEEDIVLIENCWEAETAKIKTIHSVNHDEKSGLEFYAPLHIKHFQDAYVGKLIQHDYFINGFSGLYLRDESGVSNELLENIIDFDLTSSQGKYHISVHEANNAEPILLSASAYNAT